MAEEAVRATKGRYRPGAPCPPYRCGSICGLFEQYQEELVGKHFTDPEGVQVYFLEQNFPKMVQLEFRGAKARAEKFLDQIRSGNFKEADYGWDVWRASTLFWISDVIQWPDSIHRNCHGGIIGDRVYVKQYSKAGPEYKLVFSWPDYNSKLRVVTTSFFTRVNRLTKFLSLPPLWEKRKGHPRG